MGHVVLPIPAPRLDHLRCQRRRPMALPIGEAGRWNSRHPVKLETATPSDRETIPIFVIRALVDLHVQTHRIQCFLDELHEVLQMPAVVRHDQPRSEWNFVVIDILISDSA
jgi:hypothetical protein